LVEVFGYRRCPEMDKTSPGRLEIATAHAWQF
jgi:hypothetical protein